MKLFLWKNSLMINLGSCRIPISICCFPLEFLSLASHWTRGISLKKNQQTISIFNWQNSQTSIQSCGLAVNIQLKDSKKCIHQGVNNRFTGLRSRAKRIRGHDFFVRFTTEWWDFFTWIGSEYLVMGSTFIRVINSILIQIVTGSWLFGFVFTAVTDFFDGQKMNPSDKQTESEVLLSYLLTCSISIEGLTILEFLKNISKLWYQI